MKGTVFSIEDFAINDGPGIRTTVFLKGCPLRCVWCHNPEGLSSAPQILHKPERDELSGFEIDSAELATQLLRDRQIFEMNGGGVTFTGGEPSFQHEFLCDVLDKLNGIHRAVETSGFCSERVFRNILNRVELVLFDVKHTDAVKHRFYTGVDNGPILNNLEILKSSGKPFVIRVPLIPGVNDTLENMTRTRDLIKDAGGLIRVELLRYHKTAGAKYSMLGLDYNPPFDTEAQPQVYGKVFAAMIDKEEPYIFEGEQIVAIRTITSVPSYFTKKEWDDIKAKHYLHENGMLSNISANYGAILNEGLGARRSKIQARMATADEEGKLFLESADSCLESLQKYIEKYECCAAAMGDKALEQVIKNVKTEAPKTFHEALQLLRFVHYGLWESGCYHNTLGRFDQYMYPFYKADIDEGRLTRDEAYELLLSFFLSCNKDSDLYVGMQQGDNGQSIVLGGRSLDGKSLFNELSEKCMEASYDLNLIDPKINLRVDKDTPLEVFKMGALLTKRGLGFPQYDNDDVVVPGLIRKGYSPEDASDYVVAACWEFIIPGKAMDIVNIGALPFAETVSDSVDHLGEFKTFDEYYDHIDKDIRRRCLEIASTYKNLYIAPAPLYSVFMDGTIENARDITLGAKYNNFGIHGTGIATAADSLAAIKKYIFEEKSVSVQELRNALDSNFEGYDDLYNKLRYEAPKMGNDDDFADSLADRLLNSFDKGLEGLHNERGGVFRAGTGTAMYYIWHATGLKATPDGRKAGEVIPANYSPSMYTRHKGPVSVIKSFSKQNLKKTINGGPLTIELDDTLFKNAENIEKLAMLIRTYVTLGGHQLQLNTLNKERLFDAKKHPELHRNLIVRVWGWSGYFVELDECYQDHIINRIKFSM